MSTYTILELHQDIEYLASISRFFWSLRQGAASTHSMTSPQYEPTQVHSGLLGASYVLYFRVWTRRAGYLSLTLFRRLWQSLASRMMASFEATVRCDEGKRRKQGPNEKRSFRRCGPSSVATLGFWNAEGPGSLWSLSLI